MADAIDCCNSSGCAGHADSTEMASDDRVPTSPALDEDLEDLPSTQLEIGELIHPMGYLDGESRDTEEELDTGAWSSEMDSSDDNDDSEGPPFDSTDCLVTLEHMDLNDDSTGEIQAPDGVLSGELLPQLDRNDEGGEESVDDSASLCAGLDDSRFCWSPQPWCEHRLSTVFVPRNNLIGHGNWLLATGDSTDVVSMDELISIDEAPLLSATRSAAFLDANAERVLVVTMTGQLLVWNRNLHRIESPNSADAAAVDRAVLVCRSMSLRSETWVLLATGELFCRNSESELFERRRSNGRYLSILATDTGFCALTKGSDNVALVLTVGQGETSIQLPPNAGALALAKEPILALTKNFILVGARDVGAWLSTDNGASFHEIPGCHCVTAGTIGAYAGRTYAWISLFFELDDRTELIGIDCKTRRALKLASYSVVTDCDGPEDDPPERARIDSLFWDSVRQRLWAAGCSGLTCFVPPQSAQPSS